MPLKSPFAALVPLEFILIISKLKHRVEDLSNAAVGNRQQHF
jgi:hypothetical protein